jgi:hypothetical protein
MNTDSVVTLRVLGTRPWGLQPPQRLFQTRALPVDRTDCSLASVALHPRMLQLHLESGGILLTWLKVALDLVLRKAAERGAGTYTATLGGELCFPGFSSTEWQILQTEERGHTQSVSN